jgi:Flp pilus assembly protein TadG
MRRRGARPRRPTTDDRRRPGTRRRQGSHGQGLVEFAVVISVFMLVLIGTIDLGRAVFMYNSASEAAREIARTTSVHPGSGSLGTSTESVSTIAVQQALVPELQTPVFGCVDISGATVSGSCQPGDWVRVTVTATFRGVLPILAMLGPIDLTASSSAQIQ